jgi:hypothetical protein
MKFSHLVQINDPLNPLLDPLTREQLWRGLVLRAEEPKTFVPWLDACKVLERSIPSQPEQWIARQLRYGELLIRDHVTFLAMSRVHYEIPEQKDIPASSLCMSIEEPQPELLFVRFEYDDGQGDVEDSATALYNEFRRSAYQESDIDTIRVIRQLAAANQLGLPGR